MADPTDGEMPIKRRRDSRDEVRNWVSAFAGLIPLFTSAMGFSPFVKIWSFVALLFAIVLVALGSWWHHRGGRLDDLPGALANAAGRGDTPAVARRRKLAHTVAIFALVFGLGSWMGASGRDALTLLVYGTLGDLAVSQPSDMAEPASIALRKDGGFTCFYTKATFNLRNATSVDLKVGVISHTVSLSDNSNSPLFSTRYPQDVSATAAGVSGLTLIKGTPEAWPAKVDSFKDQLTTLRRGTNVDVTVFQNKDGATACVPDGDGMIMKNYKGSTAQVSGEVVMVFPDGTWKRQTFNVNEPARIEK